MHDPSCCWQHKSCYSNILLVCLSWCHANTIIPYSSYWWFLWIRKKFTNLNCRLTFGRNFLLCLINGIFWFESKTRECGERCHYADTTEQMNHRCHRWFAMTAAQMSQMDHRYTDMFCCDCCTDVTNESQMSQMICFDCCTDVTNESQMSQMICFDCFTDDTNESLMSQLICTVQTQRRQPCHLLVHTLYWKVT